MRTRHPEVFADSAGAAARTTGGAELLARVEGESVFWNSQGKRQH